MYPQLVSPSPEDCCTVGLALQVGPGFSPRRVSECRVGALVWGCDPSSLSAEPIEWFWEEATLLSSRWLRPDRVPRKSELAHPVGPCAVSLCLLGSCRPPYRDNQSQVEVAMGQLPTAAPRNLSMSWRF